MSQCRYASACQLMRVDMTLEVYAKYAVEVHSRPAASANKRGNMREGAQRMKPTSAPKRRTPPTAEGMRASRAGMQRSGL